MSALAALADRHAPKPRAGLVIARRSAGAVEVASAGPQAAHAVFELGSITKAVTGCYSPTPSCAARSGSTPRSTSASRASARSGSWRSRPTRLACRACRSRCCAASASRIPRTRTRTRPCNSSSTTSPAYGCAGRAAVTRTSAPRCSGRRSPRAPACRTSSWSSSACCVRWASPEVWAQDTTPVAQPHDRRGRPVEPWKLGAYAPAGCLRGTARGALAISTACIDPPPAMAEAAALALMPRAGDRMLEVGLGWLRSPAHRGAGMWWHNGGTSGSRSFIAFILETGEAVAAVTNSPKAVEKAAKAAWRTG